MPLLDFPVAPAADKTLVDPRSEQTASIAGVVRAAGWTGVTLPWVQLLGTSFHPVVEFSQLLPERLELGGGEVVDYPTLEMWESWPQDFASCLSTPPLRIVGLVFTLGWRRALTAARDLGGVGSTMVLAKTKPSPWQLTQADVSGVWVVTPGCQTGQGQPQVVVRGRTGRVRDTGRLLMMRRLEETMLGHALRYGVLSDRPASASPRSSA